MRAVFADPKTDFVFKRIFGSEAHKKLLVALLDSLLELDDAHRILDLEFLTPEQHLPIEELKLSIVDVKCRDASGRTYVVEMQVLNVEGFEKRVVYNGSKAYVSQLGQGDGYPALADVIGVSICDFEVWTNPPISGSPPVPMLSRWRMRESHGGAFGLSQIQYVFLELPKYQGGNAPESTLDRWAYFFREATNIQIIPPFLAEGPFREALEVARISHFDAAELDLYERSKMAEQDARGALALSHREGKAEGKAEGLAEGKAEGLAEGKAEGLAEGKAEGMAEGEAKGLRETIRTACLLLGIELDAGKEGRLAGLGLTELERLKEKLIHERRWPS